MEWFIGTKAIKNILKKKDCQSVVLMIGCTHLHLPTFSSLVYSVKQSSSSTWCALLWKDSTSLTVQCSSGLSCITLDLTNLTREVDRKTIEYYWRDPTPSDDVKANMKMTMMVVTILWWLLSLPHSRLRFPFSNHFDMLGTTTYLTRH